MKFRFFILFVILFINSFIVFSQEEIKDVPGPEQRLPEGIERPVHSYRTAEPINVLNPRVEPPFWWIGMKHSRLEILIHDNNIAHFEPEIDYEGVFIREISRLTNPNYLFIEVEIRETTKAGTFEIVCTNDGNTRRYKYELKERNSNKGRIDPLDQSDLIYLLMPDRFANGDPNNDVFEDMHQKEIDRTKMFFRHGGDLKGVLDHLDYLEELGVTALWLNPVQENDQPFESYHGYAITDHYAIDRRFGDNELYLKLSDECEKRGIKLIMDIIPNHVGDKHWFIQDLPSEDWIHQFDEYVKTTYRAPALMDRYASEYDKSRMSDGWFDGHMPDLNQQHPRLKKYLIQNHIWWIEYAGLDAYRIDTYAYPDQEFMSEWGRAIKKEYPDFFMFAETWVHGAPIQAFFSKEGLLSDLSGSQIPGVTDFQLYYAINEAFTQEQGWTSGAARIYFTLVKDIMYENPQNNVIFLDNHDLSRFLSVVDEDPRRLKSGIAFLLTTRGIPMLYYGTELMFNQLAEPDGKVRQDFPGGWPDDPVNKFEPLGRTPEEQNLFNYVRKLANFRKENPVLQSGELMQFVPEDGVYVYFRYNEEQTVMVVMNTHEKAALVDLERFQERIQGRESGVNVITGESVEFKEGLRLAGYEAVIIEVQ